jgi:hypothetical protein
MHPCSSCIGVVLPAVRISSKFGGLKIAVIGPDPSGVVAPPRSRAVTISCWTGPDCPSGTTVARCAEYFAEAASLITPA